MIKMLTIILVLVLTVLTRFWKIDQIPPHLSNDEISIAYDAYSIANSGKDEHNQPWPLSFASHGTYKAPLYAYTLSPLVKIFGNNEVTARLPSLAAGVLTVALTGLIAFELTQNFWISIISSSVLAVTPGHIMASRMVLESNLALFFLGLGIFLFLKKRFGWGVVGLVLSMYAYHTEWILVPILIILLITVFINKPKLKLWLIFLTIILALPLPIDYLKNSGPSARPKSQVLWKDAGLEMELRNSNNFVKTIKIIKVFSQNYFGYFNPRYLFFDGLGMLSTENPFKPGIFLWPFLIPLIIGMFNLKRYLRGKYLIFFVSWLLLSPTVAAITHGGMSLVRNLNSLLPLTIVIVIGIITLKRKWQLVIAGLSVITLIGFILIFFEIQPVDMAESFQSYKSITQFVNKIENKTDTIYIDYRYGNYIQGRGQEFFGVPHLYFGFFNKWDPSIIQNRINMPDGVHYGKYVIGQIDWNNINLQSNNYYVVSIGNVPTKEVIDKLSLVSVFNDPGGKKAFEIWKSK